MIQFTRVIASLLVVSLCCVASAQTVSGRVIDSVTAAPIPNATIRPFNGGAETYSDSAGAFVLDYGPSSVRRAQALQGPETMRIVNGMLYIKTASRSRISVQLYNMQGMLVGSLCNETVEAGDHALRLRDIAGKVLGRGVYCLIAAVDDRRVIMAFVPREMMTASAHALLTSSRCFAGRTESSVHGITDSLCVTRMGYIRKAAAVSLNAKQNIGDIKLCQTEEERAIVRKADSLLALLSNAEKAAQMVILLNGQWNYAQIASTGLGAVFSGPPAGNTPTDWAAMIDSIQDRIAATGPHKIPVFFGHDCVHGNASVAGCTVFPHNIGLGCAGDSALMVNIGRVVASECVGCGIRLNFAPCIASVRNEKWGRTYEGFGETPEINAAMGAAYTRGLQGDGNPAADTAMVACPKHYMGDGGTTDGVNMGIVALAEASMRGIHLPQFQACAREQMGSVMPSFTKWVRSGGPFFGMTFDSIAYRVLKKDIGFDGFALSDWDAIVSPNACGSYSGACVAQAVNAGLDMAMIPSGADAKTFIAAVSSQAGAAIPQARIDDAVRRIIRIKFRFHLFDHPKSNQSARLRIYSSEHQSVAREAVRKSLVLLKNTGNALPLQKSERITVVGPFANDLGVQCGGWTISWQGQSGSGPGIAGQTILQGMQSAGNPANITYNPNGAGLNAAGIDKIVVVVGEMPYAEGAGDTINRLDLTKSNNAGALITACYATGKPVIVVLISGRPMCIEHEIGLCAAFVCAWLPGSMGIGVADVLYGADNFTGKLTHCWPADYSQIPINAGKVYSDEQKGVGGQPRYEYGYGLSY
jgi:beta-glucosidase